MRPSGVRLAGGRLAAVGLGADVRSSTSSLVIASSETWSAGEALVEAVDAVLDALQALGDRPHAPREALDVRR